MEGLAPLYKEYIELCRKHKNCIVLYQEGKFYEAYEWDKEFTEDKLSIGWAKRVAYILNYQLTCRSKKDKLNWNNPYKAGIPTMSLDRAIERFMEAGETIVIYVEKKQGEGDTSKIIRVKDRVISPGTYTEKSSHLVVLYEDSQTDIGVTMIDTSTGNVEVAHCTSTSEVMSIIDIVKPEEIIHYSEKHETLQINCKQETIEDKTVLKIPYQNQVLKKIWEFEEELKPIEHLNLENYHSVSTALVLCLNYCYTNCEELIENIKKPRFFTDQDNAILHQNAISQFNIPELFNIICKTKTVMGKRLLYSQITRPFCNVQKIKEVFEEVEELEKTHKVDDMTQLLTTIVDIEKLNRKIYNKKISIIEFINNIQSYENSFKVIKLNKEEYESKFVEYVQGIFEVDRIFKEGYNSKYDKLYTDKKKTEEEMHNIATKHNCKVEESAGSMKMTTTPSRFRVLKKEKSYVKAKDTTKSQVVVTFDKFDNLTHEWIKTNEKLKSLINTEYDKILEDIVGKYKSDIEYLTIETAKIDANITRVKIKNDGSYTKPEIVEDESGYIEGKKLRHPIVETMGDVTYIGNDVDLNKSIILYGINGAGKSVFSKSVAICAILAQSGICVPAEEFKISPFKHFFTRIDCQDNILKGDSSFMTENKEIKTLLEFSDNRTLVIGDEIYKSTPHAAATNLVTATVMYLVEKGSKFIFATHIHDLVTTCKSVKNIEFYHIQARIKNKKPIYDRVLTKGKCPPDYGIPVAKSIINNARFNAILQNITKKQIVSTKKSRYNNDVYMDECMICGSQEELDTHHIQEQCTNPEKKHMKHNLCVLCKECHIKEHQGKINIKGWKKEKGKLVLDVEY